MKDIVPDMMNTSSDVKVVDGSILLITAECFP